MLNDVDIQEHVKNLAENLNGLLRISVDAWYSTVSHRTVEENGESRIEAKYGIIYPNSWGSVNDTEFLRERRDLDRLLDEITPVAFRDKLLKNTFWRRDVYQESNVRLHRILAYQVQVLSYPPSWLSK